MNPRIEIQPILEPGPSAEKNVWPWAENNVLGLLQALPPHHQSFIPIPDQIRPPSPTPAPPVLMIPSWNTIRPKKDQHSNSSHAGFDASAADGDLLTDTIC
ncbi:hypothetical protein CROQUDRAFT_87868 [Cronartium quercuum f. sp. fusiforme G11]|uniref:Uncharacterized protein n=1 Tax=Cronartium quercuum f. sp. fusiforme G11 TaxID=708437 RepID=A0A9P6TFW3_9BASI|nr:hypothetical protein CROQUDRAFT_87868 [Cronartium quercuum f. sp. fusiforme G11]